MPKAPFEASKLKVERAQRHLNELATETRKYMRRDPFRLLIEDSPDPGYHNWIVKLRYGVPGCLSAIIGDVVHNLRTALDLLACDLVRLNGGNDKNVYFPFSETAGDLDEMIKKRKLHRASPDVVELIRSMKPYHGGNLALRAIHDLDVVDKHKSLIPVARLASLPRFTVRGEVYDGVGVDVSEGTVAWRLPAQARYKPGLSMPGKFHLMFPTGSPLAGKEVGPTLHELRQLVLTIVETFEAHCQQRMPDPTRA